MIQLRDVSKIFRAERGEVAALDQVSLEVEAGQFVAVRGPSGCGKSTLLSLIGGLALPTSGLVEVDGRRISEMNSSERAAFRAARLGFVFQLFHLLPYLNVLDNVLVGSTSSDDRSARQRALELLQRFGLEPRLTHRPGQLSAGERQRLAMARALLNQPALLLADEPTGNLDPDSGEMVLRMLDEFHAEGGTILLVTHDDRAASRAGRTVRMQAGRILPDPLSPPQPAQSASAHLPPAANRPSAG